MPAIHCLAITMGLAGRASRSKTRWSALDYGPVRVVTGTMGYKHRTLDASQIKAAVGARS
jgi:acetoacetate decarboxylase